MECIQKQVSDKHRSFLMQIALQAAISAGGCACMDGHSQRRNISHIDNFIHRSPRRPTRGSSATTRESGERAKGNTGGRHAGADTASDICRRRRREETYRSIGNRKA